jgi:alpha-glucosidase
VPLPWTADGSSFGFGRDGGQAPWLPQPAGWGRYSVAAQSADPASMLSLYRSALHLRRSRLSFGGEFAWLTAPEGVLAFARGPRLGCWVNLGPTPVALPPDATVLLASGPLSGGELPPDTAAWLDRPVAR